MSELHLRNTRVSRTVFDMFVRCADVSSLLCKNTISTDARIQNSLSNSGCIMVNSRFRSGALSQRSAVANGWWVSIFFHKTTEIREPICTVHTARHAKPWGPCSHSQKWRGTCPSWIYGSGASAAWCIPHPIERGSIPRFPDRKMVQDTGTR